MITEPDVALTDYGLAVECALFAHLLCRRHSTRGPLRRWFALFFGATGAAALAGGTVHGFFLNETTVGSAILWPATLLAIGLAALAAWGIGARILFSKPVARWITLGAAAQLVVYGVVVFSVTQEFVAAVLDYLPAAVFLAIAFATAYMRSRERPVLVGLAGLALTFVAAVVQQGGLALHPVYFNHNALYHVIQAVALFMIFWGARYFVGAEAPA